MRHIQEPEEIRAAVQALSSRPHARRYPPELVDRIVAYADLALSAGHTISHISRQLRIPMTTLARMRAKCSTSITDAPEIAGPPIEMLPVRVVDDAGISPMSVPESRLRVRGPHGLEIEGLNLDELSRLLRSLSC